MKVLSFLEYHATSKFEAADWLKFYLFVQSKVIDNDKNVSDILAFYSQQFRPELIPELFEGWKLDGHAYICKNNIIDFIYVVGDEKSLSPSPIHCIYGGNKSGIQFYTPKTLDEFILDCQRTGIELEWRTK